MGSNPEHIQGGLESVNMELELIYVPQLVLSTYWGSADESAVGIVHHFRERGKHFALARTLVQMDP